MRPFTHRAGSFESPTSSVGVKRGPLGFNNFCLKGWYQTEWKGVPLLHLVGKAQSLELCFLPILAYL